MGLLDRIFQRKTETPAILPARSEESLRHSDHDEVMVSLSSRESRVALRAARPGFGIDVYAALKGQSVEGLPSFGRRGARSVHSVIVELDNGNILLVRHRADEGDSLGVVSTRDAKGAILPAEQKSFNITIGSQLGDAFGVDPQARVSSVYVVGGRLNPSYSATMKEDSIGELIKALLVHPNDKVSCYEIADATVSEAYVRSATNKMYRLRSGDDGVVLADSAFDMSHGTPSTFIVRMDSFHRGQKLTLCDLHDPSKTFETAKVMEYAVTRNGVADEQLAWMQARFKHQAEPGAEDKTQETVTVRL